MKSEDAITLGANNTNEQSKLNILLNNFSFCRAEYLNYEVVCQNCWSYIEDFYEFCTKIEEIHKKRLAKSDEVNSLCLENETNETELLDVGETKIEDDANDLEACSSEFAIDTVDMDRCEDSSEDG